MNGEQALKEERKEMVNLLVEKPWRFVEADLEPN